MTIYKFSIKLSFSNIGQEKSKLQKQISYLLILIEMAAQKKKTDYNFFINSFIYLFTHLFINVCIYLKNHSILIKMY